METVCAFVCLGYRPSLQLERELRRRVRKNLARHKVLKTFEFVTALPRTSTGKLARTCCNQNSPRLQLGPSQLRLPCTQRLEFESTCMFSVEWRHANQRGPRQNIESDTSTLPIEAMNFHRSFYQGGSKIHAVAGVSFAAGAGEFLAIMGPSGSGKSTLLYPLGTLDKPNSGKVMRSPSSATASLPSFVGAGSAFYCNSSVFCRP
jgi:ABC-type glutathione transport system ATPase component